MAQERAVRTRERLLTAAAEEFAEHGYRGTTLLDVVQRTGMSKGAIYGHFASKEELARTLISEAGDELVARTVRQTGSGASAVESLRAITRDLALRVRRDVRVRCAVRLAVEAPQLDRHGVELLERIRNPMLRAVASAQPRDGVGMRSPETVVRILMSLFLGVPHPVPADDSEAAHWFDLLWEALCTGPPQELWLPD